MRERRADDEMRGWPCRFRRAGVRKETVHRIEAGKNNPDESTFAKIEKALAANGVTV